MTRVTLETRGLARDVAFGEVWRLFQPIWQTHTTEGTEAHIVIEADDETVTTTVRDADGERQQTMSVCGDEPLRHVAKRALYQALARLTGVSFPWGALTGVRPTVIASRVADAYGVDAERLLIARWGLDPSKARLALSVAHEERRLLAALPETAYALYVGVPFCPTRCRYCSFTSRDAGRDPSAIGRYPGALMRELDACLRDDARAFGTPVAIYIGGGTPTTLAPRDLAALIAHLTRLLGTNLELTVEAGRPETLDDAMLRALRDVGVTRLSINPETMHDATLAAVNRGHTVADTVAAYERARAYGVTTINMDLIAGLADETPDDFATSVVRVLDLKPEHITLHALARKAGSDLARDGHGRPNPRPDEAWGDVFTEATSHLSAHGYVPYYLYRQKGAHAGLENIGFARRGQETIYNVAMMSDLVPILGFGAGATSKAIVKGRAERRHNGKDVPLYEREAAAYGLATRSLLRS